jgi:hypothetical protein
VLYQAAAASGLSKAEILRRGLRRFAAELLAEDSPALSFLESVSSIEKTIPTDVALRHDDYLADWEIASWSSETAAKKKRARGK